MDGTNEFHLVCPSIANTRRYSQIRLKIDSGTITVDCSVHNLAVPRGSSPTDPGVTVWPEDR